MAAYEWHIIRPALRDDSPSAVVPYSFARWPVERRIGGPALGWLDKPTTKDEGFVSLCRLHNLHNLICANILHDLPSAAWPQHLDPVNAVSTLQPELQLHAVH